MRVVEDLAAPGSPLGPRWRSASRGYRAPTWGDHFARVDPTLAALAG